MKTYLNILIAALGSAFLAGYCLQRPLTAGLVAGLVLAILSLALWATARLQLGKSFSVRPKATALVTRGLYSKVRNPVYIFGTLWIVGFVLAVDRPWWLLFLLVLVPTQVIRARREAKVLEEKFGDDYRAYRRTTWF
ncbi:MAG: methyltransferase family protein [Candidatus Acidiferrales bacterium]